MHEKILRWIINHFLAIQCWDFVIAVFVEEYKKQYYEENDPTVYFSIENEVRKNLTNPPNPNI